MGGKHGRGAEARHGEHPENRLGDHWYKKRAKGFIRAFTAEFEACAMNSSSLPDDNSGIG